MIVNLTLLVTVDTDRLDHNVRDWAIQDCLYAGFPETEENIGWYVVEAYKDDMAVTGVTVEIVP